MTPTENDAPQFVPRPGVREKMRAYLRSLGDMPDRSRSGLSEPTASSPETTGPSTTKPTGFPTVGEPGTISITLGRNDADELLTVLTDARRIIEANPSEAVPMSLGAAIYQLETQLKPS